VEVAVGKAVDGENVGVFGSEPVLEVGEAIAGEEFAGGFGGKAEADGKGFTAFRDQIPNPEGVRGDCGEGLLPGLSGVDVRAVGQVTVGESHVWSMKDVGCIARLVVGKLDPGGGAAFLDLEMSDTPPPIPTAAGPAESLRDFVTRTAERDRGHGVFELETARFLEVNLNGRMNIKVGSMVAYEGQIKFTREGVLDQGVGNFLKKAISGEGMRLSYADGHGQLYLADSGKKIIILKLMNESLVVNGNDVLAFEPTLPHKITMMKKLVGFVAGGLFNVRFDGSGLLAITSHYEPMTLKVEPGRPVTTDPHATIAWSGSLNPQLKTDVSLKSFLGRGSGESIQMYFEGEGFVVVQPYEEVYFQHAGS
jgi:uncharacterized protein (AIM24 family)